MTTQTIEIESKTGKASTLLKVYALGSDVEVDSQSATEATNRIGLYTADFTDLPAGSYRFAHVNAANTEIHSSGYATTTLTTSTFQAHVLPIGFNVAVQGTVNSNVTGWALTTPSSPSSDSNLITQTRGDDWAAPITSLGSLVGYRNITVTLHREEGGIDTDAVLQVAKSSVGGDDGLIRIMGESGTSGNGSITIDDSDDGDIKVNLNRAESATIFESNQESRDFRVFYSVIVEDSAQNQTTVRTGEWLTLAKVKE